jgi:hypothetical protein
VVATCSGARAGSPSIILSTVVLSSSSTDIPGCTCCSAAAAMAAFSVAMVDRR